MINITTDHSFIFGKGLVNWNSDFRIEVSHLNLKQYDVLIFTDSKGTSIGNEKGKEWATLLLQEFNNKGLSCLLITRPKEMTVFFTLINFLNLNSIKFKYLITNVGFVDTTPKKEDLIDDIIVQNPYKEKKLIKTALCDYKLSSGELATLYSVNYNIVIKKISKVLDTSFEKSYFLGTFEFTPQINIKRKRPKEFYFQLEESNKLIKMICSQSKKFIFLNVNVNIPSEQNRLSYDAVHFTQEGHDRIFNICVESLVF